MNQIALILKGDAIYKNIHDYPYIVVNYPPVYLYLCAALMKVIGVSLFAGRLITFLASLLVLFLIYKIVRESCDGETALISAFLFIASSYIYKNNPFMRVDMLGLCFSLLGIYVFIKFDQKDNTYYSIPLFLLSLYTKQTFFSAPIATGIWLLINRRRQAIIFILLLLLSYGLTFLVLNHLTHGEFLRHNFLYNLNPFSFKQAIKHYVWFLQNHAILILFSFIFIIDSITRKFLSLFILYFIISALEAISVGKIGANTNYFFETIALSCVLTGFFIEGLKRHINENISNLLLYSALLIQLLLFLHMPFLTKPSPTSMDRYNFQRLSSIISETTGPMISEDGAILVTNKREVLFQPFEFTQLANQGLWDQSNFVNDLINRRFVLIIFSFDINCFFDEERLTPTMAEAIKSNYYITQVIGDYFLYKPILER